MQLNAEDGGNRKFIMVQLPEICDEKPEAFKAGYKTIAEIGKERIRRAGKKILEEIEPQNTRNTQKKENGDDLFNEADNTASSVYSVCSVVKKKLDVGFRVFKVDTSNMKDVYYTPETVEQDTLFDHGDNIKADRTPEDLLFHVLRSWGVDLSLPIKRESIDKRTVFFVDENALAACFDEGITEEMVKKLAARHPLRVVFRDSGFASDSVKTNIEQIFKLLSPDTDIKTI